MSAAFSKAGEAAEEGLRLPRRVRKKSIGASVLFVGLCLSPRRGAAATQGSGVSPAGEPEVVAKRSRRATDKHTQTKEMPARPPMVATNAHMFTAHAPQGAHWDELPGTC